MTTLWTTPRTISQYAEQDSEDIHVRWDDSNGFVDLMSANEQGVGTLDSLYHIARSPKTDLTNKTFYIKATGFNFSYIPDEISGIEVRVKMNRRGRVTDDTVQLCYEDNVIGENKADLTILPVKVYGGSNDTWHITSVASIDLTSGLLGVILRFKAHPKWPHRDAAFIDSVEMRIH